MTARVLWLTKGLGLGGAERLLRVMAPRLDRDRYELDVAYVLPWKDAFVGQMRADGVRVVCLGAARTVDPGWIWRLRGLLVKRRYDLIHTHSPVPAVAARLLAPPGSRFVHTEHNVWERYRWPTRVANAATYHRNRAALAVSDGVAASIAPPVWALGRPPEVRTLLHGVEPDEVPRGLEMAARARARLGLDADAPVLGTVANLTPKKDQATLLAAVDRLRHRWPALRLLLIGSGPLEDELRATVARLALDDHVWFLGSRDDVPDLLPAMDVFTLSSRYEGLPISLLEAMAAQVACVVTNVGGIPEAIEHDRDGLLVPPGDPEALADALGAVLRDDARRSRLAAAGRDRVVRDFSIDRAVAETDALYQRLLG